MNYHEEKMDLLSVPQGWWIAHCISADFALGAGVAKQIDNVFGMRSMLHAAWDGEPADSLVGACLPCGNVLNLVTKERYWHKPKLDSLKESLRDMKLYVNENAIKKIAMPKICCGLDRLNWEDVSPMIQEIFKDTDVEIMVCCL